MKVGQIFKDSKRHYFKVTQVMKVGNNPECATGWERVNPDGTKWIDKRKRAVRS